LRREKKGIKKGIFMKRTSRFISILLILQMLLATAAIGVFATDETPAANAEEEAVLDV
jgi:uncharacterized protein YpmB